MGKTCSQNEQHQVAQDNIRMDTQRRNTSRKETLKEIGTISRKLVSVNGSEWLKIKVHGANCGGLDDEVCNFRI